MINIDFFMLLFSRRSLQRTKPFIGERRLHTVEIKGKLINCHLMGLSCSGVVYIIDLSIQ